MGHFGLHDLHQIEGRQGLMRLAEKVACSHLYLWQCATGRREPSPDMARKLIAADPRLSLDGIYAARALNHSHAA